VVQITGYDRIRDQVAKK